MSTERLLDDELAFVERQPIAAPGFIDLTATLGLALTHQGLEALHRQGILIPLYVVDRSREILRRRASVRGIRAADIDVNAAVSYPGLLHKQTLLEEQSVGALADAGTVPYAPWRLKSRLNGVSYQRRAFIYSPYQVLAVWRILNCCPGKDPIVLERRARRDDWWRSWQESARFTGRENRRLAVLLSRLDGIYLPEITERLSGFFDIDEWQELRARLQPATVLADLGWLASELMSTARALLLESGRFDPLADWADLVALVAPRRRDALKGLAKLAVEQRLAVEILARCHRELAATGQLEDDETSTKPWAYAVRDRLEATQDLDRTLTSYGLSPHPSVLLVVEGETEFDFVLKALDQSLPPGWRTLIDVQNARGVTRDVTAFAGLVAPKTGRVQQDVVLLTRPPTRIVVLTDAEGHYQTPSGREAMKQKWVDRLRKALPMELGSRVSTEDLESLVEVHVWDDTKLSFELAHYTDAELAQAILTASRSPSCPDLETLVGLIAEARRLSRGLATIWRDWDAPQPNKRRIVESLFPALLVRVDEALRQPADPAHPPVARFLRRVCELAFQLPRSGTVVLRLAAAESVDQSQAGEP